MEATASLVHSVPLADPCSTARLNPADKERVRAALTGVDPSRAGAAMLNEVATQTGVARRDIDREMRPDAIATRLRSLSASVASDVDEGRGLGPARPTTA